MDQPNVSDFLNSTSPENSCTKCTHSKIDIASSSDDRLSDTPPPNISELSRKRGISKESQ